MNSLAHIYLRRIHRIATEGLLKQNEFNGDGLSNTVARFFSHFSYCFASRMRKNWTTAFDRALPLSSFPFSMQQLKIL